jgi:hypothetical protein
VATTKTGGVSSAASVPPGSAGVAVVVVVPVGLWAKTTSVDIIRARTRNAMMAMLFFNDILSLRTPYFKMAILKGF